MFAIGKAKSNSTKYTIGTTLSCIILHADTDYFCSFPRNFYFFFYVRSYFNINLYITSTLSLPWRPWFDFNTIYLRADLIIFSREAAIFTGYFRTIIVLQKSICVYVRAILFILGFHMGMLEYKERRLIFLRRLWTSRTLTTYRYLWFRDGSAV